MRIAIPLLLLGAAGCNGHVTLALTDAPVDGATAVAIQFTGLELERADGEVERFDFDPPRRLDVLGLEGGGRAVLLDEDIRAEDYRAIRLRVSADGQGSDSFIDLSGGGREALELDTADEGKLKLARSFSVASGDSVRFTVDFDLRRSVLAPTVPGQPYRLVPVLRLAEDSEIGALAGTVADALVPTGCVPAVYVFSGHDATPDDVGSAAGPLNSGRVRQDPVSGDWEYHVGVLPEGGYTAALTCDADDDRPDANDSIVFKADANATVQAGRTETLDF